MYHLPTRQSKVIWRQALCAPALMSGLALALFATGCNKPESTAAKPEGPAEQKPEGGQHGEEVKLNPDAVKKLGLRVQAAEKQVLIPTLTAPARVSYNTEAMAHVGAVIGGRIVELKVRKGDVVKKGDDLVVIESPQLGEAQSDLLQKRTNFEIAGPAVELAKSAYDRARSLYDEQRGIALTEVQKRETDYKAAVGALRSAKAGLTAAENKLHLLGMDQQAVDALAKSGEIKPRYSVIAPIAGTVISREVTLGELVNPEKESLLVIADMTTLWVLADVPEARLKDIAIGSNATVKIAALSTDGLQGTVSLIDPALDPNTRTARVRIEVKANGTPIRPGMFAQTQIAAGNDAESAPVLAVPDEAVQTVDGKSSVFVPVPGEENTFKKRQVELGKSVGGMIQVLSGLKEKEPVVVAGSFLLKAELGKGSAEEQ